MSIRTLIYERLAADQFLIDTLATMPQDSSNPGPPPPAIYEIWAAPNTEMPYINLTFSFISSGIGVNGALDVDIFYSGYNTRTPEAIGKRIKGLLDRLLMRDPEDGPIVIYYSSGPDTIPEPVEGITHWNMVFNLRHWDKSVIEMIENR